jgi:hypothetical protein
MPMSDVKETVAKPEAKRTGGGSVGLPLYEAEGETFTRTIRHHDS